MQQQKTPIFYEPSNEINEFGNGAAKRSFQIYTLLKKHFAIIEPKKQPPYYGSRIMRYYYGILFFVTTRAKGFSIKNIQRAGNIYLRTKKLIEKYPDAKYLVWESTTLDFYLRPLVYKMLNINLICFPHNIESLVPEKFSPITRKKSPDWFTEEIRLLQANQCVFTISKEEKWLLSLFTIPCEYYPYVPGNSLIALLTEIRNYRINNAPEDFYFIFGSYFYAPIQQGINEMIELFIHQPIKSRIIIAGYGTEKIKKKYTDLTENIRVLGSVSTEKLNELLKKCKAVLINQAPSTGALTKLPELQMAGVPVIANEFSLRDQKNTSQYYIIHTAEDLISLLENTKFTIPPTPDPNYYEARVIEKLNKIINQENILN